MKILLIPIAAAAPLLAIGLAQTTQYDLSLLINILTELPVAVLIVWLIIKLDDRRRQSSQMLADIFMELHKRQMEFHRQTTDQLLEVIAFLEKGK